MEICLFRVFVLWVEKNFSRNSACILVQLRMVLVLRELSQILALSFNVKGKNFNLIKSKVAMSSLKVLKTSSNSRIIRILTLHAMESGEKRYQVGPNNHILSWGYNARGFIDSWRVYVVPHGPICIEVPIHSLLTLLLFMWGFHLITI